MTSSGPGSWLLGSARRLLPGRLCETLVLPAVADMQHEYLQAATARERAVVLVRGYWSLLAGASAYLVALPARRVQEGWCSWNAPGPRLLRQAALGVFTAFVLIQVP